MISQETYLSADDLRINLWHMEITDQSFNIVDIKPANMEELTEVGFTPQEAYSIKVGLFLKVLVRILLWLYWGKIMDEPLIGKKISVPNT